MEKVVVYVLGAAIGGALGKALAPLGRQLGLPMQVTTLACALAGEAVALRLVRGR